MGQYMYYIIFRYVFVVFRMHLIPRKRKCHSKIFHNNEEIILYDRYIINVITP